MTGRHLMCSAPSPESAGISSRSVLRFIDRIEVKQVAMHGFLFVRGGQIAAEAYWPGFRQDQCHRIYSASKSIVGLAIGCMADEGKISLDDPVVSHVPDLVPDDVHPYLARTTIRDLLIMATPHTTNAYTLQDTNWARAFFERAPSHPPGTVFSYDTAATVVLGTIIERLSGLMLLDYLRPRLLGPIGFSRKACCIKTPEGTSWGGSGILCTLRDLARLALLCMNKGEWDGRRLISHQYIAEATSRQIDTSHCPAGRHGYGYQIWIDHEGGFSFRGMGSQLALCRPGRDFLFACFADTQGDGTPAGANAIVDAMQHSVYESLSDDALPEDPDGLAMLHERISSLCWRPLPGQAAVSMQAVVDNVLYRMEKNPMGITEMRFLFRKNDVTWLFTNGQGNHHIKLGIGWYAAGRFPQKGYYGMQIGVAADRPYACRATAMWAEPDKLNCRIYITDINLGTLNMTFTFRGAEVTVWMQRHAEWFLDEYQGYAVGSSAETAG
jgi:CubicO group peptidase (beta-lactamase class C family)